MNSGHEPKHKRREWLIVAVLLFCALIVAFWETASSISRRPFAPFELTTADFDDFLPESDLWAVEKLPVNASRAEPNILVLRITPRRPMAHGSVAIRLVHGYNMRDCMRIKGYNVILLSDSANSGDKGEVSHDDSVRIQTWRLVSEIKDESIWVTAMVRAADFGGTNVDTREMAFPRIEMADNPNWLPHGITLKSLRHPIVNFRQLIKSKWNNARCDLLTFLKLRQPAWASDTLLTLVASTGLRELENEQAVIEHVSAVHAFILAELRKWKGTMDEHGRD